MTILTLISLLIAVIALSHVIQQRRAINQMNQILYAVADDVQEVRNVTHGKPSISFMD